MDLSQSILFEKESTKQPLHLYGANGFPVGVYQPLLNKLSAHYNIGALANRALWQPRIELHKSRRWQIYADDLINYLEHQNVGPVIGVGHSLGGTATVLAAIKRPDLFSKLILIEPAMTAKPLALMLKVLPKGIVSKINPAKGTLNKPDRFISREQFHNYIKKFNGYAKFSDEMFELFSQHSLVDSDDGHFELAFPKKWEAHNYTQPPNIMSHLSKLTVPVVGLRGKPSLFFSAKMWSQWRKVGATNSQFFESPAHGHLLPLEAPALCADLILQGLAAKN